MSTVDHAQGPHAPTSSGVTNVRLFNATTTSQTHELPASWRGRYVAVRCEGGTVDYFYSSLSTASIDRTVAASAAGASSTSLGARMADGDIREEVVPSPRGSDVVYLVRQADVSTAALRIELRGVRGH